MKGRPPDGSYIGLSGGAPMQIVVRQYPKSFELFIDGEKVYEDLICRYAAIMDLLRLAGVDCVHVYQDPPAYDVSDW